MDSVLGATRDQGDSVDGFYENSLPSLAMATFLLGPHMERRENSEAAGVFSHKGTNPITRPHPHDLT